MLGTLDRSAAANLARNILDNESVPTDRGIKLLAKVILDMDTYITKSDRVLDQIIDIEVKYSQKG